MKQTFKDMLEILSKSFYELGKDVGQILLNTDKIEAAVQQLVDNTPGPTTQSAPVVVRQPEMPSHIVQQFERAATELDKLRQYEQARIGVEESFKPFLAATAQGYSLNEEERNRFYRAICQKHFKVKISGFGDVSFSVPVPSELIGKMAYVVQHSANGHASIKFAGLERQISGQMTSDDGRTDVDIYVIIPDMVAGVEPEVHNVHSAWDVPI